MYTSSAYFSPAKPTKNFPYPWQSLTSITWPWSLTWVCLGVLCPAPLTLPGILSHWTFLGPVRLLWLCPQPGLPCPIHWPHSKGLRFLQNSILQRQSHLFLMILPHRRLPRLHCASFFTSQCWNQQGSYRCA